MNVQTILNNVGGDNQQILAQLIENPVDGYTSNNKPKQKIVAICQESGQQFNATIYPGTGLRLDQRNVGEVLSFSLAAGRVGQGKVFLSGFWNSNYTHIPPGTATPGQVMSGAATPSPAMNRQVPPPQQPAPPPVPPPQTKEPVDWDAKEKREKRGYAIRDATLAITTLATILNDASKINKADIVSMAACFVDYIYTGGIGENAQQGKGFQQDPEWDNYVPPQQHQ